MIDPTPITKIPVPKKKDEAIEMPKYLRNITFKKVYKLAQPKLIINLPSKAEISEPKLTENDNPTNAPASIVPTKYVKHIQAIAKAQVIDLLII